MVNETSSCQQINRAKRAFTTRRVPAADMALLLDGERRPQAGDLVLARVEEIGHHKRLERPDGRRAQLYPGDEIIVCYGNRYAPDQFEAEVPADFGPCDLVAAGGLAATALAWHDKIDQPTRVTPIALVGDTDGRPLNIRDYAVTASPSLARLPTIAVLGTSMNSGKTTTVAALVRGLALAGHRVGAVKLTGTGAGGDLWSMIDAGASEAVDFTDAGFASTYLAPIDALERSASALYNHLAQRGCTAIVAEVADGLFQAETAALVATPTFRGLFPQLVFATQNAMGAVAGVERLHAGGHDVLAVSGIVTRSPLARREAEDALAVPCLDPLQLAEPATAMALLALQPQAQAA